MGEPAVDPLIETLEDEDWRVRGAAAWSLGNLGDEKAIPALEKLAR
jgi:PBS lyase HEAT-like repeat.